MRTRCRFLGTRRDLPEIYRALDLFVQPSLWEGLPLALLKAMGAGLPVVATRVSGSREAIVDGVNGRLVAPGDPQALARAILETRLGTRRAGGVWRTRPGAPWRRGIPWRPCCGDWKSFIWTSGRRHAGLLETQMVLASLTLNRDKMPSWPVSQRRKTFSILHTEASLGWGGQERRILVEALAMRQRGHRLAFACDPRGELYRRARLQVFR